MRKHVLFEMWGDFLKNRRAQRPGVDCGIINHCDKTVYKTQHKENQKQKANEPIFIEKITFSKTLGPNGTVITMVP